MGKTRFEKIEETHLVDAGNGRKALVVDLHLINDVTSAQAYNDLREMNMPMMRPQNALAVTDHVVGTGGSSGENDIMDQIIMKTQEDNCKEFGVIHYGPHNGKQGIAHVVGPDVGLTHPNSTIFCGDSHTSTHGAFGAVAAGIGTSSMRDIFATGCLLNYTSPRQLRIRVEGKLDVELSAKDLVLSVFEKTGNRWATEGAVLFCGSAIDDLSMEGRMTVCNMTIEMGGRYGYCDVDEKTIDWFRRKKRDFFDPETMLTDELVDWWYSFNTDEDAQFDDEIVIDAANIKQMLSFGLTLNDVMTIEGKTGKVENVHPERLKHEVAEGTQATDITFDHAFLGSCTNGRVEDFLKASKVVKMHGGKIKVKQALAVPGSSEVKAECEALGLHQVFIDAGFEWRDPGCSSCLAMNPDKFDGRVASSTNRNFPGRQGPKSRTFLMSPESVVLAALEGKMTDIKAFYKERA